MALLGCSLTPPDIMAVPSGVNLFTIGVSDSQTKQEIIFWTKDGSSGVGGQGSPRSYSGALSSQGTVRPLSGNQATSPSTC
ncbi:hypothetical protein MHYP_G00174220 [Metynnis hypsauchen]